MTRTARGKEQLFDPEIEKTARRLRKESALQKQGSSASVSDTEHVSTDISASSAEMDQNQQVVAAPAAPVAPIVPVAPAMPIVPVAEERTLQECNAPPINHAPLCIAPPPFGC